MKRAMFCSFRGAVRLGLSVACVLGVLITTVPTHAQMVLLPDNRIILGTVAEIAGDQVKVYTVDVMPRYLSVKQAQEKGIWPLHVGDHLHIVVNEQNMVLGYHQLGDMGSHYVIHGRLAEPLMVGQQWAAIHEDGKDTQTYRVRPLVRSKLAAVPVGSPAVFLIDETNQIMDTAFGSEETLRIAAQGWHGSPPKGVNRQLSGTIVKAMANGEVTIRTQHGVDVATKVRPFLNETIERLPIGERVILLLDNEDQVADISFGRREDVGQVTDRPSAGGPMGEDATGKVGREGPRALPPGQAPGYEGADKGKRAETRVGSQAEPSPPLGPPEDPVTRAR